MAIKIRTNSKIKGFIFNDKEKKISQFADDSTLTLINLESICETILTVNEFSKHAGLRLNVNKSEAFLLGPLKHLQLDSYAGVKICHVSLKCIGINIAHDKQMCEDLNWIDKIKQFENLLQCWSKRHLMLFGKSLIVNVLAISKLIYNFTILTVPEYIIVKIEKNYFKFYMGI